MKILWCLVSVCSLLFSFSPPRAQQFSDSLDRKLMELYEDSRLPGFAVAIIDKTGVRYQKGFGYSDLESQTPFTPKTRSGIASISKTFIGIALMQAIEQGKLKLDTAINDFLPFKVVHPLHPDIPITIRQLATHTAGINDHEIESKSVYMTGPFQLRKGDIGKDHFRYLETWSQNRKWELGDFLAAALVKGGGFYSRKRFLKGPPGSRYQYSNLGAALMAYLLEQVFEESFSSYVSQNIIQPLGLKATKWTFEEQDNQDRAVNYFENRVIVPQYSSSLYPSGGLVSNCIDLSQYLLEVIRGSSGGSNLLTLSGFRQMLEPKLNPHQFPPSAKKNYALFWELNDSMTGHNGGNYGIVSFMAFDRETNVGKVFLTNISSYQEKILIPKMVRIWKALDLSLN